MGRSLDCDGAGFHCDIVKAEVEPKEVEIEEGRGEERPKPGVVGKIGEWRCRGRCPCGIVKYRMRGSSAMSRNGSSTATQQPTQYWQMTMEGKRVSFIECANIGEMPDDSEADLNFQDSDHRGASLRGT